MREAEKALPGLLDNGRPSDLGAIRGFWMSGVKYANGDAARGVRPGCELAVSTWACRGLLP